MFVILCLDSRFHALAQAILSNNRKVNIHDSELSFFHT